MKKLLVVLLSVFLLTACSPAAPTEEETPVEPVKVALLIGNRGDLSFNDSAVRGVEKAGQDFADLEVTVIEYGEDVANFEPSLLDAADAGYNMIIVSSSLVDLVAQYAPDYPETTFVIFDASVDYTAGNLGNVYSIVYKANEPSLLAGFLAAKMSSTGVIAFLGGKSISVIWDFYVGYVQGAKLANPDIKVATTYAGSWSDPAKGKELALTMFAQGADVIFNVAGGTGIGGIEAAVEQGKWAIGVDSDQAMIYDADGKTDYANAIISSALKNVDNSLYRAISMYLDGTLAVGTAETLGIAEGGVGLADNSYYQANVPADVLTAIADLESKVTSGEVVVDSGYGPTADDILALETSVAP